MIMGSLSDSSKFNNPIKIRMKKQTLSPKTRRKANLKNEIHHFFVYKLEFMVMM